MLDFLSVDNAGLIGWFISAAVPIMLYNREDNRDNRKP